MASRVSLSALHGVEEVQARLRELPKKVETRIMRKAMRDAFKLTLAEVKSRVPVEHGHLKRSIKLRKRKVKLGHGFAIFTDRAKLDPTQLKSGFYPAHLELGYVNQDGDHEGGLAFMRGALEATRHAVLAKIKKLLFKGVNGELVKMT